MGVDGESRQILDRAQCSFNIQPENSSELANTINKIQKRNKLLKDMGQNGYIFLEKNYSRKILANKMIEYLQSVI